ncbi:uncharacterized protein ACNLHF_027076 [Anomaloglossus baeobatrachus]
MAKNQEHQHCNHDTSEAKGNEASMTDYLILELFFTRGSADLSELHALYFDVLASPDKCDPINPLCIVSPECELYTWEENRNAEDRWTEQISVTHVTCTDIRDEISSTGWGLKNIYEEVSGIFEAGGEMQFTGNRGSFPIRAQQRGNTPVQRSFTPVTSVKEQQKYSSSMKSQQRSNSPANFLQRDSSPVPSLQRSYSPVRSQQRSSSPVWSQQRNSLSQQISYSPGRSHHRSDSPVRSLQRNSIPPKTQQNESSHLRSPQKKNLPIESYAKTPAITKHEHRYASSVGIQQRSTSPARSQSPSKSFDKNCPWKENVNFPQPGTNKVAQSTVSFHGPSRAYLDPPTLGVSRRLTSSTSSIDSECSQRGSSSRTNYTTIADIPRAKRLRPDLATLSMKGRMRSPGKAEVERMFGQERRTTEALEAFQALEAGLIESLSGKYSLMQQRRARRQSTPCLYPEESVRMRQELQMRRASLHPTPRTDMEFSGTKAAHTRSRDPSPYRTGAQGRAAFREPEWMDREKILRPVGSQDKKEEKFSKNTDLAWKNRETFLKSVRQYRCVYV